VFYYKLRFAEGCGNGIEMIFVTATMAADFVCAGRRKGGPITYLNALITT
jgi:hypothetical protein